MVLAAERLFAVRRTAIALLLTALCVPYSLGRPNRPALAERPHLAIPRLQRPPVLEDFLTMSPRGESAGRMAKVSGFVQREPNDGDPVSENTDVYVGYDQKNFYTVFVCFDREPEKIRARLTRREDIFDDETVEVMLDTFQDERRAYVFQANPFGVQWDGIYTEAGGTFGTDFQNFDASWDTVWNTHARLTDQGYVVFFSIPFKSLRFRPSAEQTWGIIFNRYVQRTQENAFWPTLTHRVQGRLNQAAVLTGLEGISPGRNLQLIPYGIFRSFHALDTRDPNVARFSNKDAQGQIGLDSKYILHDSLVLDVTANPDFSQVESDDPQVTLNQRFEVFFPEKRPFFLENADYFQTPMNLVFTRRIVDPQFGSRLTGRVGPYAMGMFVVDDRAPGVLLPDSDPNFGRKAYFAIGRLSRDLPNQSNIGLLFTDKEFNGAFNRVGGVDTRLKFRKNWTATGQAVVSSTRLEDGVYLAGPAYKAELAYSDLHINYDSQYNDLSPNFVSEPGFIPRVDMRETRNTAQYTFRPKSSPLLSWGPRLFVQRLWGHDGTFLDGAYEPAMLLQFKRQTSLTFEPYSFYPEQLRPVDFNHLAAVASYNQQFHLASLDTSIWRPVKVHAFYGWGPGVNYLPHAGGAPFLSKTDSGTLEVTVTPKSNVKIDNTYLFNRVRDFNGMAVFNNHIVRSKINYQITRELSLRFIEQYTTVLANPGLTSLATTKQFNSDFLITYLVHPNTAVYVGYNSDLQNLASPLEYGRNSQLLRTRDQFMNDGRLFFVKLSYLFRF